jgi:hypothetical protein
VWREREPYCAAYVYTTEQVQQPKAIDLNNADRELERTIRQCRLGNALAWEALMKHFQAQVYGFAYYYLRNRAEAQDATQDVFIKVFNSLNKLEQKEAAFPAWLLTIARNTCLDRLRKSRTRAHYEDACARLRSGCSRRQACPCRSHQPPTGCGGSRLPLRGGIRCGAAAWGADTPGGLIALQASWGCWRGRAAARQDLAP